MFIGTEITNLKNENHLIIPNRFTMDGLSDFVVTSGFEKNLLLVPQATFNSIHNSIKTLNLLDPSARLLNRLVLGRASVILVSNSREVVLPQSLVDFAEFTQMVAVVGQGSFIELWSLENWTKQAVVLDSGEINFHDNISLTLER